jgi:hypothetical protein
LVFGKSGIWVNENMAKLNKMGDRIGFHANLQMGNIVAEGIQSAITPQEGNAECELQPIHGAGLFKPMQCLLSP